MRNILVAVSGLTPQVVSETLYCLTVQKKIQIDEIVVITTTEGKKNIDKYYLKNRKTNKLEGAYSLEEEIEKLCKLYKVNRPIFNVKKNVIVASEENVKMHDVRTDKDNILFPNVVTNVLKTLTADERNMLFCSLSGGRKTMSAYMGFALSLYAREGDKLFHVLASENFENSGKFYPRVKTNKDLILSEVPFIRLRPVLKDKHGYKNKTYSEIIEQSQKELERLNEDGVVIDMKKRTISYNGKSVKINPVHLALYLFFVFLKEKNTHSFNIKDFVKISDRENKHINQIYNLYLKIYGKTPEEYESMFSSKDKELKWFNIGIDGNMFRSYRSKINDQIELLFSEDKWLIDNFILQSSRNYGSTEYSIYAPLDRFIIN